MRFPVTLSIALGAMVFSIIFGIPAGILSGVRQGTLRDRTVTFGSSLGVAIPDFWLAIMLVTVFAVDLHLLPALGYTHFTQSPVEWAEDLLLPWLALGIGGAAMIARQVRGAMIDTLDQDYMRTARAKGLGPRVVIGKHALKNALSPAVTVIGISFGYLLGGTVIIEQIFSLPGIGTYVLEAISREGPAAHPGRGPRHGGVLRPDQPRGRHHLRLPEPEGPPGMSLALPPERERSLRRAGRVSPADRRGGGDRRRRPERATFWHRFRPGAVRHGRVSSSSSS